MMMSVSTQIAGEGCRVQVERASESRSVLSIAGDGDCRASRRDTETKKEDISVQSKQTRSFKAHIRVIQSQNTGSANKVRKMQNNRRI
jgi:hypothetical protein